MAIKLVLTVEGGDDTASATIATRIAIARLIGWFSDAQLELPNGTPKPGALLWWNVEQATSAAVPAFPPPNGGGKR